MPNPADRFFSLRDLGRRGRGFISVPPLPVKVTIDNWILASGKWNDIGIWIDTDLWID